ncbi:hypothetical protein MHC_03680 [Mycoplasma haemocanis str. Illinois]|uniref:Uncharacterized protein n=1 Tax=Mycoplasma haemocanis (strain Illinois) TaxID=1111676 RepID=H6N7H4_MYCHN|nr:hypothetical protein [Mycoplasma haemocanis]AEW45596.1 hypothetical protein MHC_03680 [Mycoplasma haemocanis str. Illinois]
MSKVTVATIAGLGSVGIGGGIYLASGKSNFKTVKETIQSRLLKDKYTPLNSDESNHSSYWATSLEKYNAARSGQTAYTQDQLKGMCKDIFNKEENSDDYNVARKYCVIPQKISERLSALSFKAIDTTGSDSGTTEKWKKLSKEYKSTDSADKQLDNLASSGVNEQDGTALKGKCKDVLAKEHWDQNYDSLLERSKIWCTEEGLSKLPNRG